MSSDIVDRLGQLFEDFDGIVTGGPSGSRAYERGDQVIVALTFEDELSGYVAKLTANQVFSRLGTGTRLDGRAPVSADPGLDQGGGNPGATYYGLSIQQATVFDRAMRYATGTGYDPHQDHSTELIHDEKPFSGTPLFVLLGHAFKMFCRIYENCTVNTKSSPSLGVWSNVLRPFNEGAIERNDLVRRTIISRRTARALLRDLERLRWIEKEKDARGQVLLRLTQAGDRAREAGARLADSAERDFASQFGTARTARLRKLLASVVNHLDIELPWYLTGYGPGDSSITGGDHVPEEKGPPRIPSHGADWPVVLRDRSADIGTLPLSALLSQALAAYRIDYDRNMRGHGTGLDFVANFLQFVDDEGLDLKTATDQAGVTGNGRSALERHFVVVTEPKKGRGVTRKVFLTPKGRRARRYLSVSGEYSRK